MKNITHQDVEDAQVKVEFLVDDFLRQQGWRSTSTTPDCVWMWTKTWEGQRLLVHKDDALRMEAHYEDAEWPTDDN